jgi:hypothetical protein
MIILNANDRRISDRMGTETELHFVRTICLPELFNAQNSDGAWGFYASSSSRVEPTCWAIHALLQFSRPEIPERLARGLEFLRRAQLPDGSWPNVPGDQAGCWVTSLACWALCAANDSSKAVARGLQSLCNDWPSDSSRWRRFLTQFSSQRHVSPINTSLRGWPWTHGTSSWVEPTAFALLSLGECSSRLQPHAAIKRRKLAEAMLYDRMCPGGGWNCGNPLVYGVAGEPLVIPTAFALLALRHRWGRSENIMSLNWLENTVPKIRGLTSLALARLCVEAYGHNWPEDASDFRSLYQETDFAHDVQTLAWCCLALATKKTFLTSGAAPERTT